MNNPLPGTATGFVILGNQLFPPALLRAAVEQHGVHDLYMAEDPGLCTYVRHHQQKIVMFLGAMRAYGDELRQQGLPLHYDRLPEAEAPPVTYEARLEHWVRTRKLGALILWEIEDKEFEHRLVGFARSQGLALCFLSSPMFLTPRALFQDWLNQHRPHMADFYRWQRQRLGILVDDAGRPQGGQWSFDTENRKPLPRKLFVPPLRLAAATDHVRELIPTVRQRFGHHPGELTLAGWWLPTTRAQALRGLDDFLEQRLALFGPYEDALSDRDPFLFHSVLTPALNLGLITPAEVVERTLRAAAASAPPLASLEGFLRQVIGWREFIRGIYRAHSELQARSNFFGHQRQLSAHWYEGTTGLPPLDQAIRKAQRWGWAHHIERLMVLGNLMTLCEIQPRAAHQWFMEMFVDSSDWVMGPNVYGMALFADGGVFATKPYLCGSNYLLKMSDDPGLRARKPGNAGSDWRDTVDGLYWRFIHRHRDFFGRQVRLQRSVAMLDRLEPARRQRIFTAAEDFLASRTAATALPEAAR